MKCYQEFGGFWCHSVCMNLKYSICISIGDVDCSIKLDNGKTALCCSPKVLRHHSSVDKCNKAMGLPYEAFNNTIEF